MKALVLCLLFVLAVDGDKLDLHFSQKGAQELVLVVLDRMSEPATLLEFETKGEAAEKTRLKGTQEQIQEARILATAPIADRAAKQAIQASEVGSKFEEASLHDVLGLIDISAPGDPHIQSAMRRIKEIVSGYKGPPEPSAAWPVAADLPDLDVSTATGLLRRIRAVLSHSASIKLLAMHRARIPKDDDSTKSLLEAVRQPLEHLTFHVVRETKYGGLNQALGACAKLWKEHQTQTLARLLADVQDLVVGKQADDAIGRIYAMDDLAEDFDALSPGEQDDRIAKGRELVKQKVGPLADFYLKAMEKVRESEGSAVEALREEVVSILHVIQQEDTEEKDKLRLRMGANILSVFLKTEDIAALRAEVRGKSGQNEEL